MNLADERRRAACRDRTGWGQEHPELAGFEQIVARFQEPYTDSARRQWIEARLRAWKEQAER